MTRRRPLALPGGAHLDPGGPVPARRAPTRGVVRLVQPAQDDPAALDRVVAILAAILRRHERG